MVVYILLLVTFLISLVLSIRLLQLKQLIKKTEKQLRETAVYSRYVSVELIDKDMEALVLSINRMMGDFNRMVLESKEKHQYLKESIADISHDMRTPLTSTIGYLQLLEHSELNVEQRKYLEIALEKSQSLRKLLENFYELTVLVANDDVVVELTKVDLAGIVSEVILNNANSFSKKAITPIFEMADIPAFIFGETEKLHRIIENLVANCLKYSCGDVIFKITNYEEVCLTIENPTTNIGIIDTNRLFDRFYKADVARNEQGTGLGLSIAQLLTKSLGGSISAQIRDDLFIVQLVFLRFEK